MSSKEEATNVFNEGLIMDLNPLTTPDNVLTDCLNGTIITYNGNELVLQNDQGNFQLKNARLSPNFIPVGVKEYADILYIVSYNPLSKKTEIGSYPSPQRIFSTQDRDNVVTFTPIIPNNTTVDSTYTELVEGIPLQIYTNSNDNDSYMLNPNDEFRLAVEKDLDFPYQDIQFSILSEDKELFDIEIPDEYINQLAFKKVFWEVPGWLTGKYTLANLQQFYLNVRNLSFPEFITDVQEGFDATLNFNTQLETIDSLFVNNPNTVEDLKVELTIWVTNQDGNIVQQPVKYLNSDFDFNNGKLQEQPYTDVSMLYYYNFNNIVLNNITLNNIIHISAVPVLHAAGSVIWYEQFRTDLELNLNSVSDANDINAANIYFKHTVAEDSMNLMFNITGPFVNNTNIKVIYDIINMRGNSVVGASTNPGATDANGAYTNGVEITDVNYVGQNILTLPLTTVTDATADLPNNTNKLQKEDIYLFVVKFFQGNDMLRAINKVLITTETLNEYYSEVNDFTTELYAEDWIAQFENYAQYRNVQSTIEKTGETFFTEDADWPDTYLQPTNVNSLQASYRAGYNIDINGQVTYDLDYLTGRLWSSMNPSTKVLNNGIEIDPNNISFSTQLYLMWTFNITVNAGSIRVNDVDPIYLSSKMKVNNRYPAYYSAYSYGDSSRYGMNFWAYNINTDPTVTTRASYTGVTPETTKLENKGDTNNCNYHGDRERYAATSCRNLWNLLNNTGIPMCFNYLRPFQVSGAAHHSGIIRSLSPESFWKTGNEIDTNVTRGGVFMKYQTQMRWNRDSSNYSTAILVPVSDTGGTMSNGFDVSANSLVNTFNNMVQVSRHVFYVASVNTSYKNHLLVNTSYLTSQNTSFNIDGLVLVTEFGTPLYSITTSPLYTSAGLNTIRNRISDIYQGISTWQTNSELKPYTFLQFGSVSNLQNVTLQQGIDYSESVTISASDPLIQQYLQTVVIPGADAELQKSQRALTDNQQYAEITKAGFYHDLNIIGGIDEGIISEYETFVGNLGGNINNVYITNRSINWTVYYNAKDSNRNVIGASPTYTDSLKLPRFSTSLNTYLDE